MSVIAHLSTKSDNISLSLKIDTGLSTEEFKELSDTDKILKAVESFRLGFFFDIFPEGEGGGKL